MKAKYIIPLFALLLLTACGRKDETAALSGQTFYMPENVAFTSGLQQVTGGCAVGDTVYLIGLRYLAYLPRFNNSSRPSSTSFLIKQFA